MDHPLAIVNLFFSSALKYPFLCHEWLNGLFISIVTRWRSFCLTAEDTLVQNLLEMICQAIESCFNG
jgi:hypothetical protein